MMSRFARNLTNLFKSYKSFTRVDTRHGLTPVPVMCRPFGAGGIMSVIASWLLRGSPYRGIVGANGNSPMVMNIPSLNHDPVRANGNSPLVMNIPPLPNDPCTNGGFGGMTKKKNRSRFARNLTNLFKILQIGYTDINPCAV